MTQQKHTDGPWKIDSALSPKSAPIIYSDKAGTVVCSLHYVHRDNPDNYGVFDNFDANARVLVAAPELLEALQEARFTILEMAHNGGALDNDSLHSDGRVTGHLLDEKLKLIDAAIAKATGDA